MSQNEQKKRKGPRELTPEEIQFLKAKRAERERKLATDPEYRKKYEERKKKHAPFTALIGENDE